MDPALRILKNSTALSVSVIFERASSFLLPWYLARTQSQAAWGDYNIALAFVFLVIPFAYWGLDFLLPREIGRERSQVGTYLASSIVMSGIVSIIIMIGALIVVRLLNYPDSLEQLLFLAILTNVIPRAESKIHEAAIQGLERMEWIALIRLPTTLLRTLASIFLISHGYSLGILFVLFGLQYLFISFLYLSVLYGSVPGFYLKIMPQVSRHLFVQAIPLVLITFAGSTVQQSDRIFLSKWWDSATVGLYATGALPVDVIKMVILALMASLFPGLSRVFLASTNRLAELTEQLVKYISIGIFPIIMLIISFADWIVILIFGEQYAPSANVLRILAFGILFFAPGQIFYHVLLASHHERLALQTAIIRSGASLFLYMLLIPRYGILGVSVAVTVTELIGLLRNLHHIRFKVMSFDIRYALIRPMGIILTCVIVYLLLMEWSHIGAGFIVIGLYVCLLISLQIVTKKEIVELMHIKGFQKQSY